MATFQVDQTNGPYFTIQDAVDAAKADNANGPHTVEISTGSYQEQVVIDGVDGLSLVAVDGPGTVTIMAPSDVDPTGTTSSARAVEAVVTVANSTDVVITD